MLDTLGMQLKLTEQKTDTAKVRFKVKEMSSTNSRHGKLRKRIGRMTQNIKFRKTNDTFQRTLNQDIKSVRSSNKAFFPADKTRNMYEMDKDMLHA